MGGDELSATAPWPVGDDASMAGVPTTVTRARSRYKRQAPVRDERCLREHVRKEEVENAALADGRCDQSALAGVQPKKDHSSSRARDR